MIKRMLALLITIMIAALPLFGMPRVASAAKNPALDAEIMRLALDWEHIKFMGENLDQQEAQMAVLAERASAMVQRYQENPEAVIWWGIIMSEQASMANENGSPIKALRLASSARDLLEKVVKADASALDAGAPTSLGVLYYRVPRFPLGFGDHSKARQYLQTAVKNAPDGLDANYFYADFLVEQHEYDAAAPVLKHVLAIPPHPERPIWDSARREIARELLAKIDKQRH